MSIAGVYWLSDKIPAEFLWQSGTSVISRERFDSSTVELIPFNKEFLWHALLLLLRVKGRWQNHLQRGHRYRFGPEGKKTVVIDFDIGLRNLDLIMGCERRVVYDFVNVIQGDASLNQALIKR